MEIVVNGVRISYEVAGTGAPMLLCHGNGADHTVFDRFAHALSDRYTLYMPDSRGHGASQPVDELHYTDMADDMAAFITALGLEKPVMYGLSDGGIIGLMLAIRHPDMLSKLVISGANTAPSGLRLGVRLAIGRMYRRQPTGMLRMVLREPHITRRELGTIRVPTLVLAGQKDIIRKRHTLAIAKAIPGAQVRILPGEGHVSYIEHSDRAYGYMKDFLQA